MTKIILECPNCRCKSKGFYLDNNVICTDNSNDNLIKLSFGNDGKAEFYCKKCDTAFSSGKQYVLSDYKAKRAYIDSRVKFLFTESNIETKKKQLDGACHILKNDIARKTMMVRNPYYLNILYSIDDVITDACELYDILMYLGVKE